MSNHVFQVNLRGMIELLSGHLYSTPKVFVRELLQNSVDAVRMRESLPNAPAGSIQIELSPPRDSTPATLTVLDNGIGLTEAEVHAFLATIGASAKRGVADASDYLGQFGIGLLSGFVVSDEIVVVTQSAKDPSAPAVEWRGSADGVYSVRTLEASIEPGTRVFLRAREDAKDYFEAEALFAAARHYGGHLPVPVTFGDGQGSVSINQSAPWLATGSGAEWRDHWLDYGREHWGLQCLDAIPLHDELSGATGAALVLPMPTAAGARQSHVVYLKDMLVSDHAEDVLPSWAIFVRCILNTSKLNPTASREGFQDDDALESVRTAAGSAIRDYLLRLAKHDRAKLDAILAVHCLPIKALAVDDDEFYKMVVDLLPFETTLGQMTLPECLRHSDTVLYASTCDRFRQIASVAAAQGVCVVNAGYVYDLDLLEKLPHLFDNRRCTEIDIDYLVQSFEDLSLDEREETFELARLADLVLQPYGCQAEVQKFLPAELPTLYTSNDESDFLRSIEQTKERTDGLWAGVLSSIAQQPAANAKARLTLNYQNVLIRRLAELDDKNLSGRVLQMLYVQGLILGRQPLGSKESALLGEGLLGLIDYAMRKSNAD